ncbi:hypothetical protein ACFQV2_10585 [Actinokineospora soli]|uniref:Uncharacterized protein n=1 Tax=Actinokineospora soli TaxID=1048753 RepID=A0ABW2TJR8_9PSEU
MRGDQLLGARQVPQGGGDVPAQGLQEAQVLGDDPHREPPAEVAGEPVGGPQVRVGRGERVPLGVQDAPVHQRPLEVQPVARGAQQRDRGPVLGERVVQVPDLVQHVGPLRPRPRVARALQLAHRRVDLVHGRAGLAALHERRRQRDARLTGEVGPVGRGDRRPQVPDRGDDVAGLEQRAPQRPLRDRQRGRVGLPARAADRPPGGRARRGRGVVGQPQRPRGLLLGGAHPPMVAETPGPAQAISRWVVSNGNRSPSASRRPKRWKGPRDG